MAPNRIFTPLKEFRSFPEVLFFQMIRLQFWQNVGLDEQQGVRRQHGYLYVIFCVTEGAVVQYYLNVQEHLT